MKEHSASDGSPEKAPGESRLPSARAGQRTRDRLREIHQLQSAVTSSPSSHDVIELALATATSLPISKLDGTALVWLIVAGAPSSDKTATVLTLKNAPNIFHLDTMTEHSFVSGFIDPKSGEHAKDLLDELNGKCLVIKDMTSLFSQRDNKVKQILGDLQSIYDGQFIKFTRKLGP